MSRPTLSLLHLHFFDSTRIFTLISDLFLTSWLILNHNNSLRTYIIVWLFFRIQFTFRITSRVVRDSIFSLIPLKSINKHSIYFDFDSIKSDFLIFDAYHLRDTYSTNKIIFYGRHEASDAQLSSHKAVASLWQVFWKAFSSSLNLNA